MTPNERKTYIENRLALAQCCSADFAYKNIVEKQALGGEVCRKDLATLKYITWAIKRLSCYNPIGSTIKQPVNASALLRITAVSNPASITLNLKNGATTLATFTVTSSSTVPGDILKQFHVAINAGFATNQTFSAMLNKGRNDFYDANGLMIFAAASLGASANAYTTQVVINSGSATYTIDGNFLYGKNAVLGTYNNFSDAQVDSILEKIEGFCGCGCDKSDAEILDDTVNSSV